MKLKKYVSNSKDLDEYLQNNKFNCVQTQMILVKDFYKLIKQESQTSEVVLFAETGGVFKVRS